MYYDYDHRLVIKILKVKVTDWLPNATGLKNHHSLIRKGASELVTGDEFTVAIFQFCDDFTV